ncbi:unnamed protein product [Urochloa humidicola]
MEEAMHWPMGQSIRAQRFVRKTALVPDSVEGQKAAHVMEEVQMTEEMQAVQSPHATGAPTSGQSMLLQYSVEPTATDQARLDLVLPLGGSDIDPGTGEVATQVFEQLAVADAELGLIQQGQGQVVMDEALFSELLAETEQLVHLVQLEGLVSDLVTSQEGRRLNGNGLNAVELEGSVDPSELNGWAANGPAEQIPTEARQAVFDLNISCENTGEMVGEQVLMAQRLVLGKVDGRLNKEIKDLPGGRQRKMAKFIAPLKKSLLCNPIAHNKQALAKRSTGAAASRPTAAGTKMVEQKDDLRTAIENTQGGSVDDQAVQFLMKASGINLEDDIPPGDRHLKFGTKFVGPMEDDFVGGMRNVFGLAEGRGGQLTALCADASD